MENIPLVGMDWWRSPAWRTNPAAEVERSRQEVRQEVDGGGAGADADASLRAK